MQSLLEALKARFKEWPDEQKHFTCDPDGEVRGSTTVNDDFYPEVEVDPSEHSSNFGNVDGTVVTKEIFESI